MPQYCPSVCPSVTFSYRDHICWNSSKIISPPNSDKIVMWRFLRNRRLLLCLHTIFRALIYWAHRAVILAIAWHLVYSEVEMLRSQWIQLKYCMQYDRLSQQQLSFLFGCWAQLSQESDMIKRGISLISCQKNSWWLTWSRVPMLNFVWTNHVCKRSLLFRCVSSENSLKYALSVIVGVISWIVNIYGN